jgi:hypothetical protein
LRKKESHFCDKHKEKIQSFCLKCKEFSCFYCVSLNGEHFGHENKLLKDALKFIDDHNEELTLMLPNVEKTISSLKEEKNFITTKLKEYIDSYDNKISFLQESFLKDLKIDPNMDSIELCLRLKRISSVDIPLNGNKFEEIKINFNKLDEIMSRKEKNVFDSKLVYTFNFDCTQQVIVKNGNEFRNGGLGNQLSSNVMSTKPIPPNSICYFEVNAKNLDTCSFFGVIPEGYAGINDNWLCSCGPKNRGYGIQGSANYLKNGMSSENLGFSHNSSNMDFGILVDTRDYTISFTYNNLYLKTFPLEKNVRYYPAMMIFLRNAVVTVTFPSESKIKKIFEKTSIKF